MSGPSDRSTHSPPSATSTVHVARTQARGGTATVQVKPPSSSSTSPAPSSAATRTEVVRRTTPSSQSKQSASSSRYTRRRPCGRGAPCLTENRSAKSAATSTRTVASDLARDGAAQLDLLAEDRSQLPAAHHQQPPAVVAASRSARRRSPPRPPPRPCPASRARGRRRVSRSPLITRVSPMKRPCGSPGDITPCRSERQNVWPERSMTRSLGSPSAADSELCSHGDEDVSPGLDGRGCSGIRPSIPLRRRSANGIDDGRRRRRRERVVPGRSGVPGGNGG